MFLRELFEAPNETIGLIFGRFNPPHKGHKAAWQMASETDHWVIGTNESTIGPKDPLPSQVKVVAMETIWPEAKGHIVFSQSWLTLASELYQQYPNATLRLYTDEEWVPKTINQYNGKEGPHGSYNFKNIEWEKTPRLASATDLRAAVLNDDPKAFSTAAGVPADTVIEIPGVNVTFFELVKKYLEPHRDALEKSAAKKKQKKVKEKVGHNTLLSQPKLTLVIDTPGDLDWYKLGQHYPTLAQQDPNEFGQEDSDTVMTFSTPAEMSHMKRMLDKMGAKYKEIGGTNTHPEVHEKWKKK